MMDENKDINLENQNNDDLNGDNIKITVDDFDSGDKNDTVSAEEAFEKLARLYYDEKKKSEEYYNRLASLQAEYENYRKRNKEVSLNSREDGYTEVITKLLPMVDAIDQALTLIKDANVLKGIKLIKDKIERLFEEFGVTKIVADNAEFDPNFHNAIMSKSDAGGSGRVLEVYQSGYMRGGKVIRPASVIVSV